MAGVSTGSQDAPRRCEATTRSGQPCQGWAMAGSTFCYTHNPDVMTERTAARSRGGKARHGRRVGAADWGEIVNLDARVMLQEAQNVAMALEPSVSKARVLGYLAGQTVRVREFEEIEQRVSLLEERIAEGMK